MQKLKNKISAITIAIILGLSMSGSILLIPSVSAHTPAWKIPTYAFINVNPNPIGVGQTITVYMWLANVYGEQGMGQAANVLNNYRFSNYNLTIIQPDGTSTTTIFPFIADTTSSQSYAYTPSQVGTYTFIFNYPGQTYGAIPTGLS